MKLRLSKMIPKATAKENIPALNLFTRNRFASWGLKKHFYPAGQDALIMAKVLKF